MKSMSTESSQRLLAMDLLGDDEVDEVYDWGNRAVLDAGPVEGATICGLFDRQVAAGGGGGGEGGGGGGGWGFFFFFCFCLRAGG